MQIIALMGVAFGVALVASGRGKGLSDADPLRPPMHLPEQMSADQVGALSFSLGVRGYRMDEVDLALERIESTLRAQEAEIRRLNATLRESH